MYAFKSRDSLLNSNDTNHDNVRDSPLLQQRNNGTSSASRGNHGIQNNCNINIWKFWQFVVVFYRLKGILAKVNNAQYVHDLYIAPDDKPVHLE